MEPCYMVSISVLEDLLRSEARPQTRYSLLINGDTVTMVHYGAAGLIDQRSFPVVYRIPDVPPREGTMMLLVATERNREQPSFWQPLESKLLSCCALSTPA